MIYLARAYLGVTCFFNIVAPGGHKIFDHQMGDHKNIAEVLLEIHDPYSKENGGPVIMRITSKTNIIAKYRLFH